MEEILRYYYRAKEYVYNKGYFPEVYWQENQSPANITQETFYSEYAWVVLSSGMRESIVQKIFPDISQIFAGWKDPEFIALNEDVIKLDALKLFNNKSKIEALVSMAKHLIQISFLDEINNIKNIGFNYLERFPFLGPVTSLHFAKNLGFHISKPDRHLIRISNKFGFSSPVLFCKAISDCTGDKESVIDIILWRFAIINKAKISLNNG